MAKNPKAKINQATTIESVITRSKNYLVMYKKLAKNRHVVISNGNNKLGDVTNVSLPPVITCGKNCKSCKDFCYAVRLYLKFGFDRKDKKLNPWLLNYAIYLIDPDRYFNEINNSLFNTRYFRWHTSGDIIDVNYFDNMIKIALKNPSVNFLAFTKQYDIVNSYIAMHGGNANIIPENLHLLFSASPQIDMINHYNLPECHINFENSELNTFKGCTGKVFHCGGNCTECIQNGCGCFNLKNGDVTLINQH